MNKKLIWIVTAALVVGLIGCGETHAPSLATSVKSSAPTRIEVSGFNPVDPAWFSHLKMATVQTSNGESVPIFDSKPVLFVAPWCEYCHRTLELLQKNHLLSKVTVVGVGFEYGSPSRSEQVNLAEAITKLNQSMSTAGVQLAPNQVRYALPGTIVDKAINGYPEFFVQRGGKWYSHRGFTSNLSFWEQTLT